MKLENSAKAEKGFIEKSLTIQNLDDGTYLITAKAIPTGKKKEQTLHMVFTQNGLNALVGTWLMFADKEVAE